MPILVSVTEISTSVIAPANGLDAHFSGGLVELNGVVYEVYQCLLEVGCDLEHFDPLPLRAAAG